MFLWFATLLYLVTSIAPGEVASFDMEVRGESIHVERAGDRWVATSPNAESQDRIYARLDGETLYFSTTAEGAEEAIDMTEWFEGIENPSEGIWIATVQDDQNALQIERVEGGLAVTTVDGEVEELVTTVTWTLAAPEGDGSGGGSANVDAGDGEGSAESE